MAHVHCDQPDLLLCYSPGAAGRLLVQMMVLSPEVHSWSPELEAELNGIPISHHADRKLEFIKDNVFPSMLNKDLSKWKRFEPQPWDARFEKTRKFIRHAWTEADVTAIDRFNCKKVAYVDIKNCQYFILRAIIAKNGFGIVHDENHNTRWYVGQDEAETRRIIVDNLHEQTRIAQIWRGTNYHPIKMEKILFGGFDGFRSEYEQLCRYYEITPVLAAYDLLQHWLSLQWQRSNQVLY